MRRQALLPRRLCAQVRSRDLECAVPDGTVLGSKGELCWGKGGFSQNFWEEGHGVSCGFKE